MLYEKIKNKVNFDFAKSNETSYCEFISQKETSINSYIINFIFYLNLQ